MTAANSKEQLVESKVFDNKEKVAEGNKKASEDRKKKK